MPRQQRKRSKPGGDASVTLFDMKGKKLGNLSLDKAVFDHEINSAVLHQISVMYQARQRRGTASTKTRKEVSGGGKKPWRQKGTGRARVGSIRNPIWRGGGIAFGPKRRNYGYSVPASMKKVAVKSGLNSKLADEKLVIIDKLDIKEPKTKLFRAFLDSLQIKRSALVVVDKLNRNIHLASRNIPKVAVKTTMDVNAFDILRHDSLVVTETALKGLAKRV